MQARILKSSYLHQGDEDLYSFSIDWGEEKTRETIVQIKDSQGNILSQEVKSEKLWEQKGSRGFNLIRHASPRAGSPTGEWELVGILDKTVPHVLPQAIVLATQPERAREAVQAMLPALQEDYLLATGQPGPTEIITDKRPFPAP